MGSSWSSWYASFSTSSNALFLESHHASPPLPLSPQVKLYEVSPAHSACVHDFMLKLVASSSKSTRGGARSKGKAKAGSQGARDQYTLWKHNRTTLMHLLLQLKSNEDIQQQQLALTVLETFPRLTRPYLKVLPV